MRASAFVALFLGFLVGLITHAIAQVCRDEHGPWPALDVVVEGRGGKLCLSPEIQSLGEDELLALTTEFCTEARIGEHGCAYHVLGLILVFLGKEAVAKQPLVIRAIAYHFTHEGRHQEACSLLESSPSEACLVEPMVTCLRGQGKQSQALSLLNQMLLLPATQGGADFSLCQYRVVWVLELARLLGYGQGQWGEALAALDMEDMTSCPGEEPQGAAACLRARALSELDRWAEARSALALGVQRDGKNKLCTDMVAWMLEHDPSIRRRKLSALSCYCPKTRGMAHLPPSARHFNTSLLEEVESGDLANLRSQLDALDPMQPCAVLDPCRTVLAGTSKQIIMRLVRMDSPRVLVPHDSLGWVSNGDHEEGMDMGVSGWGMLGRASDISQVLLMATALSDGHETDQEEGVIGMLTIGLRQLIYRQPRSWENRGDMVMVTVDRHHEVFSQLGPGPYLQHIELLDGWVHQKETDTFPLILNPTPRELQRMTRDGIHIRGYAIPHTPMDHNHPKEESTTRFFVTEMGWNDIKSAGGRASSCQTIWSQQMFSRLLSHPRRTLDAHEAHVIIFDVETAYEMNWPHYGAFGQDDNWAQPQGVQHRDRWCWRPTLDGRVVDLAMADRDLEHQSLLVFDMHAGPLRGEWPREDVIVAGSDLNNEQFYEGHDIGFPPMPQMTFTMSHDDLPRYLLTFQGRATHPLRLKLATLHNPQQNVIIRVACMLPNESPHCIEEYDYDYSKLLEETVFALVPRGDHGYSYRLLEVMSSGAIPVILSDGWMLPFEEIIDWSQVSIRVPEVQWEHVVDIVSDAVQQGLVPTLRAAVKDVYLQYFQDMDHMLEGLFAVLDSRRTRAST